MKKTFPKFIIKPIAIVLTLAIALTFVAPLAALGAQSDYNRVGAQAGTNYTGNQGDGVIGRYVLNADNRIGNNQRPLLRSNLDGSLSLPHRDDATIHNIRAGLPPGTYFVKIWIYVDWKGLNPWDLGGRIFYLGTGAGDYEICNTENIVEKQWKQYSVQIRVPWERAFEDGLTEIALRGPMCSDPYYNNVDFRVGREVVISTKAEEDKWTGDVLSYVINGDHPSYRCESQSLGVTNTYGKVSANGTISNIDRSISRTDAVAPMVTFSTGSLPYNNTYDVSGKITAGGTLAAGTYFLKTTTKVTGYGGADLNAPAATLYQDGVPVASFPSIGSYDMGRWTNNVIPFTTDGNPHTYTISGPQNGVSEFAIAENFTICYNDTPMLQPMELDQVFPMSGAYMDRWTNFNGVTVRDNTDPGNTATAGNFNFDIVSGDIIMRSDSPVDRVFWDFRSFRTMRQQHNNAGLIKPNYTYKIKLKARVDMLAPLGRENDELFCLNIGGYEHWFKWGQFTVAGQYQTLSFDWTAPNSNDEQVWCYAFWGNQGPGCGTNVRLNELVFSQNNDPLPGSTKSTGMIWPEDQLMPSFAEPAEVMTAIVMDGASTDDWITVKCLQGLINREQPRIITLSANGGDYPSPGNNGDLGNRDIWQRNLGQQYYKVPGATITARVQNLIDRYKGEVNGYVPYGTTTALKSTANLAVTEGAIRDALVVSSGNVTNYATSRGITTNVSGWTYTSSTSANFSGFSTLGGDMHSTATSGTTGTANNTIRAARKNVGNFIYGKLRTLGGDGYSKRVICELSVSEGQTGPLDLAYAMKAPVIYLQDDANTNGTLATIAGTAAGNTQQAVLITLSNDMGGRTKTSAQMGPTMIGFWPGENGNAVTSQYNVLAVPSNNVTNMTWQGGLSRNIDPPEVPAKPTLGNKNYVAVIASDGDNMSFMDGAYQTDAYWNSRNRNAAVITHTMQPGALDMAPQELQWYYNSSGDNNSFTGGPSGLGYSHAEKWQNATQAEKIAVWNNRYFEKTGINTTTVWHSWLNLASKDAFLSFNNFPSLLGVVTMATAYNTNDLGEDIRNGNQFKQWASGTENRFDLTAFAPGQTPNDWQYQTTGSVKATQMNNLINGNVNDGLVDAPSGPRFIPSHYIYPADNIQPHNMAAYQKSNPTNATRKSNTEWVRLDHMFMLMNEAYGYAINNALQKPANASSSNWQYAASKAVDGSFGRTHGWQANKAGNSEWLEIDMGTRVNLSRYVLKNAELAGFPASYNTSAFRIQASNDGEKWVDVAAPVTGNTAHTVYGNFNVDQKSETARYRLIRVLVDNPGSGDGIARIQDIEIWGLNNTSPTTPHTVRPLNANVVTPTKYYRDVMEKEIARYAGLTAADFSLTSWAKVASAYAATGHSSGDGSATPYGSYNSGAYTQAQLDEFGAVLRKAIDELEVNTSLLEAAITLAGTKTETDWSEATWTTMIAAKTAASNAVTAAATRPLVDENGVPATTQSAIDLAESTLSSAILALAIDKTPLLNLITTAENKTQNEYSPATWAVLLDAIAHAKAVAGTGTYSEVTAATKQSELKSEVIALQAAIDGLDVDKTALLVSINSVSTYTEGNYSSASWGAMLTAKADAQTVYDDEDAKQYEIEAAKGELDAKLLALTQDWTALDTALSQAALIVEADWFVDATDGTWAAFVSARTAANAFDSSHTHTGQFQGAINAVEGALTTAMANLHTNKEDLEDELDISNAKIEEDYEPISWGLFAAKRTAANAIFADDDATQTAIDNVTAELIVLREALTVDITALNAELDQYAGFTESDYSEATWGAYDAAYEAGFNLAAQVTNTELANPIQSAINTATANLTSTRGALANDRTALIAAIGAADDIVTAVGGTTQTPGSEFYEATSWTAFIDAIAPANTQNNASAKQSDINTVTTALANATNGLTVDKAALATAISAAISTLNAAGGTLEADVYVQPDEDYLYSDATWGAVLAALTSAEDAIISTTIVQYQVNALTAVLNTAVSALGTSYAALDSTIASTGSLSSDNYEPISWGVYAAAKAAADEVSAEQDAEYVGTMSNQSQIDAAEDALQLAIDGLAVDYSELLDAVADAGALTEGDYSPASWLALQTAIAAQSAVIAAADPEYIGAGYTQAEINAAEGAIRLAISNLGVDKTALVALIEDVDDMEASDWSTATWAILTGARNAGAAIVLDEDAKQGEVGSAITAINLAIAGLSVDKSVLTALIGTANAVDPDLWSTASYAALELAITAAELVEADTDAKQSEVDDEVTALQLAIDGLSVDKSELTALIATATAIDSDLWSSASYATLAAAITAAEAVEDDVDATQPEVDDEVIALQLAIDGLAVDYSELTSAIAYALSLTPTDYDAVKWADVNAALIQAQSDALTESTTPLTQKEIKASADALNLAISRLAVNIDDLEAAIAIAAGLTSSDYSPASWAKMQAKLTAARAVLLIPLEDLTQSAVDKATNELNIALDALTVDYTALSVAIAVANTKVEGDWSAATWSAFAAEKLLAEALAADATTNPATQSVINTAASNLNAKIAALAVDRTLLVSLLAETASGYAQADYSIASWKNLQDEIDYANRILAKSNALQSDINKAYDDILAARALLSVEYGGLNNAIALTVGLVPGDYTEACFNAMLVIKGEAVAMAALEGTGVGEPTQEEISAKEAALRAAVSTLTIDKSALAAKIGEAVAVDPSLWSKDSYATLASALTAAQSVNATSAKQNEIDAALTTLESALVELGVDMSELETIIDEAYNINRDAYSSASITAVLDKVAIAEDYIAKEGTAEQPTQAEINQILREINIAIAALTTDTTALEAMFETLDSLDEKDYSKESWLEFRALVDELIIGAFSPKMEQREIDALVEDLEDTMEVLAIDLVPCFEAIKQANKYKNDPQYTQESRDALIAAFDQALAAYTDTGAKQWELDAGEQAIYDAIAALEWELLYGDAGNDGSVSTLDALTVLQVITGQKTIGEKATLQADVDGVAGLSATDALLILQKALGLIETFPVQG